MKFLILTQYFPPEVGASQTRLLSLCRELNRAGHGVEVVTAMPNHPRGCIFPAYRGKIYQRVQEDDCNVHRVWIYASNKSNFQRLLSYFSFVAMCFVGLMRSSRPDYVFVDSPPLFLGVSGWIAAKWWHARLVFNVADLWPDSVRDLGVMNEGLLIRLAYLLEHWTYRHADYVTAVTEGIQDALIRAKRLDPQKVLFLPNGVDTQLFRPGPPSAAVKEDLGLAGKKLVLYAGNHGYAGAVEQVLYAAQYLLSESSFHFLFVGDGPEKERLKAIAAGLSLKNVTFHDAVPLERLPAIISISDIAVVTLRKAVITEGARPAKLFVMMAAGKPVVLAGRGEAVRLVEAAGAGIVVPPEEPAFLAVAIRSLLENPADAEQAGRNGRSYVVRHFEWSSLVREWISQLADSAKRNVRTHEQWRSAGRGVAKPY